MSKHSHTLGMEVLPFRGVSSKHWKLRCTFEHHEATHHFGFIPAEKVVHSVAQHFVRQQKIAATRVILKPKCESWCFTNSRCRHCHLSSLCRLSQRPQSRRLRARIHGWHQSLPPHHAHPWPKILDPKGAPKKGLTKQSDLLHLAVLLRLCCASWLLLACCYLTVTQFYHLFIIYLEDLEPCLLHTKCDTRSEGHLCHLNYQHLSTMVFRFYSVSIELVSAPHWH